MQLLQGVEKSTFTRDSQAREIFITVGSAVGPLAVISKIPSKPT